jgi:hypothetical protein
VPTWWWPRRVVSKSGKKRLCRSADGKACRSPTQTASLRPPASAGRLSLPAEPGPVRMEALGRAEPFRIPRMRDDRAASRPHLSGTVTRPSRTAGCVLHTTGDHVKVKGIRLRRFGVAFARAVQGMSGRPSWSPKADRGLILLQELEWFSRA